MSKGFIRVDLERGFFPATAKYPASEGFGELPVGDAHELIPLINRLTRMAISSGVQVFDTFDNHPAVTGHFAKSGEAPDFNNTWPVHCVSGTPGSQSHPDLLMTAEIKRFAKGTEQLQPGQVDTSYTGMLARDPSSGLSLPDKLRQEGIDELVVCGLALGYCPDATAIDAVTEGFTTRFIVDATRAVHPEQTEIYLARLARAGVECLTSADWMEELSNARN